MFNKALQNFGLAAYKVLSRSGVMSHPAARSLFLKAYAFYKRTIEAGPVGQLQKFVRPGTTVIDVGANIGFFTEKFADWVGPSGKVIAIEPDEENFEALSRMIAKSGLSSRIVAQRAVVAAEPGVLRLERNEMHPGDHKIAVGDDGVEVPAVSIDSLVRGGAGATVSLIKIDVQGAEMMVLAGATETLAAQRPALFIEVDDRALAHFGTSRDALLSHLENFGYRMHTMAADGSTPLLERAQLSAELEAKGYTDVLFLAA